MRSPRRCFGAGMVQLGNNVLLSLIHISEPTRPVTESRIPAYA
ncbi:hypothetical protein [Dyella sp. ASV21]|nr:hypothetical protein [Dyella sp. ASV21]